jgi:hypothetical protein
LVVFAVHLHKLRLKIVADVGENGTKSVDGIPIEDPIAILGDEDQVGMQLTNAVSTVPNVTRQLHRPSVS